MNKKDKDFYDSTDEQKISDQQYVKITEKISLYLEKYIHILEQERRVEKLKILELGAGSCCLSLLLSKKDFVESVVCLDISKRKMETWTLRSNKVIKGNIDKLTFIEGDFSKELEFSDSSFDVVLFDGALHHTRSMWVTIEECKRILKKNGLLIAQREQYLGLTSINFILNRLLNTEEVKNGVSENAYLKKQYEFYLKAYNFHPKFISVAESLVQKIFLPLNGLFYSKWVIIARRDES